MLLIAGGSPPRMRGKELHVGILLCGIGITPAYAGKSLTASSGNTGRKDHPRVCGEKRFAVEPSDCPWGSPPRMRGKEKRQGGKNETQGITPAYAGKRVSEFGKLAAIGDHPRICGEKVLLYLKSLSQLGITPAYAGKRVTYGAIRHRRWDHPRICGEKSC